MLQSLDQQAFLLTPELAKDKELSSSTSSHSCGSGLSSRFSFNNILSAHVEDLFRQDIQPAISSKMSHKAVSWLLTISWSKNYSLPSSWTALLLFYAYQAKKAIQKHLLESILLTCLQLATKIHQTFPLKTSELLLCCNYPVSRTTLNNIEQELLLIFNYDILVPHTLQHISNLEFYDEEIILKILFICELYLAKNYEILFDTQKVKKIAQIVIDSSNHKEQIEEIQEMINHPSNKIILNKFSPKFDLQSFLIYFS